MHVCGPQEEELEEEKEMIISSISGYKFRLAKTNRAVKLLISLTIMIIYFP